MSKKHKHKTEFDDGSIWVQCEDPMCMKWRKVHKDMCDDFSQIAWFCHMNLNPKFNSCEIPQEAMNIKKGRVVIFSELECGLLVWAKMASFPRWPGIISHDPAHEDGDYIIRYADGTNDPKYYHIEFLGKPHSHAWVSARFVETYNTATVQFATEKIMNRKRMKLHLQHSLMEASQLTNLTNEGRLKHCVYKYVALDEKENNFAVIDNKKLKTSKCETESKIMIKPNEPLLLNISGKVVPVYPYQPSSNNSVSHNKNQLSKREKPSIFNGKDVIASTKLCGVTNPIVRKINHDKTSTRYDNGSSVTIKTRKRKNLINVATNVFNDDQSVPQSLQKDCHGKEHVTDESVFWNTFKSFCNENQMGSVQHIMWYNKSLDLFKFYQKVQFMGGYRQATSHWKIWRNICWEVIAGRKIDSQFLSLKKAYRQVLLPFEKYQRKKVSTDGMFGCTSTGELNINDWTSRAKNSPKQLNGPTRPFNHDFKRNKFATSPYRNLNSPTIPFDFDIKRKQSAQPSYIGHSMINTENTDIAPLKVLLPAAKDTGMNSIKTDYYLPSSNPNSPSYAVVESPSFAVAVSPLYLPKGTPFSGTSELSDIGLDFAINELNSLEKQLDDTMSSQLDIDASISSQLTLFDDEEPIHFGNHLKSKIFEPITNSEDLEEMNDVIGELTDLDESLLEMTSDILGSMYP